MASLFNAGGIYIPLDKKIGVQDSEEPVEIINHIFLVAFRNQIEILNYLVQFHFSLQEKPDGGVGHLLAETNTPVKTIPDGFYSLLFRVYGIFCIDHS